MKTTEIDLSPLTNKEQANMMYAYKQHAFTGQNFVQNGKDKCFFYNEKITPHTLKTENVESSKDLVKNSIQNDELSDALSFRHEDIVQNSSAMQNLTIGGYDTIIPNFYVQQQFVDLREVNLSSIFNVLNMQSNFWMENAYYGQFNMAPVGQYNYQKPSGIGVDGANLTKGTSIKTEFTYNKIENAKFVARYDIDYTEIKQQEAFRYIARDLIAEREFGALLHLEQNQRAFLLGTEGGILDDSVNGLKMENDFFGSANLNPFGLTGGTGTDVIVLMKIFLDKLLALENVSGSIYDTIMVSNRIKRFIDGIPVSAISASIAQPVGGLTLSDYLEKKLRFKIVVNPMCSPSFRSSFIAGSDPHDGKEVFLMYAKNNMIYGETSGLTTMTSPSNEAFSTTTVKFKSCTPFKNTRPTSGDYVSGYMVLMNP